MLFLLPEVTAVVVTLFVLAAIVRYRRSPVSRPPLWLAVVRLAGRRRGRRRARVRRLRALVTGRRTPVTVSGEGPRRRR